MAVVFAVFICLCVIIKILSFVIGSISGNGNKNPDITPASEPAAAEENGPEMSCGELKLYDVDERTAAMIMAIVSDESGIPLNELNFKSIRVKN
jgi:Na+-transporting methylmalonyl-CoA/oxaloacetate decarboxylase gamma subunit